MDMYLAVRYPDLVSIVKFKTNVFEPNEVYATNNVMKFTLSTFVMK